MELKVVRWGDDLGVRLTGAEAERLGVSEGQTVEVTPKVWPLARETEAPVVPARRYVDGVPVYTLADMIAEMRRLGPGNEPETVDWGPDVGSEIIDDDDPS